MSIEIIMMIAFILACVLMMWKLYSFMPTKPLEDDDQNEKSIEQLELLMLKAIKSGIKEKKDIFNFIISDKNFDKKHFWRFNENRLNQLLNTYMLKNKISKIEDI